MLNVAHLFQDPPPPLEANKWWWNTPISNLHLTSPPTLPTEATCQEAITALRKDGFHEIPIVEKNGHVHGVVTLSILTNSLISGKVKPTDTIEKILVKNFRKLTSSATVGRLSRILEKESYVVIIDEKQTVKLVGIATQIDVLNYIIKPSSTATANGFSV